MTNSRTALLNNDRIELTFPYDLEIIQVIRNIPGRQWNKVHKHWTVPSTPWHMSQVIKVLKPYNFYIDEGIRKYADAKAEMPRLKFPKGLYDYQKDAVKFAYASGGRCIIADEMGLGKTVEALVFLDKFCGKTLIISPASVVLKWEQECHKWTNDKSVAVVLNSKVELPEADILIMSYTVMTLRFEELNQTPFNCLIADESQYIKSHKARRTRCIKALVKAGIPHVLFLSGTPFMNRPSELFPVLNMLDPKSYSNFYHFAARYCNAQYEGGYWYIPPDGVSNLDELAQRLSHIMVRRTKKDVALQIPDLTRSYVPIDLDNWSDYVEARRDIQSWLKVQGQTVLDPNHVLTRLNALRQIVGRGKVTAALELAEDILNSNDKVVLFAHHKEVVKQLTEGLKDYGVGIIAGDTPAKDRQGIVDDFLKETLISQNKNRVMIITVAGAEGIDLYSASHIIFVEREWTPAREEQAEARLHRIGQKNPVTAYYIVGRNSIDEKMNDLIAKKRDVFGQVIRQDEVVSEVLESLRD